jgi:hypothetical protein
MELKDLLQQKDFVEELAKSNSDEEMRDIFKSKGVDITDDEIEGIKELFNETAKEIEKLSPEEIEELKVSGGGAKDILDTVKGSADIIGAVAGLIGGSAHSLIKNKDNEDLSTGKKILNAVVEGLTGAAAGFGLGTVIRDPSVLTGIPGRFKSKAEATAPEETDKPKDS